MSTIAKLRGNDFDRMVAIPEYWVVDIQSEQIYVHRTPSQGIYQSIQSLDRSAFLSPLCQPAATLSLAELFDLDS